MSFLITISQSKGAEVSDIPKEIRESLSKIYEKMTQLFIEIAVSEEKLSNKVTEADLEKAFRAFEKELQKTKTEEDDKLNVKFDGINTKFNAINVTVARNSVIVSIVVSIIVALAVSYIKR